MPVVDPGYRLPSGDLTADDLNCMIVFYPDRDEYRRALWGALDYLGTWKAWERDAAKRGKDAAAIWKQANECTWECFTMGCLDQLTDDVAAIKGILLAMDPCCDGLTTVNPGPGITTDIDPGFGDPPDYYGETAISDWDDWTDHVCYNAHRWVDQLIEGATQLEAASDTGALSLGVIAALLALLSFTGIGIPISFALAATVLTGLVGVSSAIFGSTASDLEDARDDIICALIQGLSVYDVIEDALGSASLDWLGFYQWIDYDSVTAIIYEGGANGEYLPSETDDTCSCSLPAGYNWVPANVISATADANTYGRVNTVSYGSGYIQLGDTVATSASWGCQAWPAGVSAHAMQNTTYQTLAVRYTWTIDNTDGPPWLLGNCLANTGVGFRYIRFYTYDAAQGIDATWAATQADTWSVEAGGHAKRAASYTWNLGAFKLSDTTAGNTGRVLRCNTEFLVWVT